MTAGLALPEGHTANDSGHIADHRLIARALNLSLGVASPTPAAGSTYTPDVSASTHVVALPVGKVRIGPAFSTSYPAYLPGQRVVFVFQQPPGDGMPGGVPAGGGSVTWDQSWVGAPRVPEWAGSSTVEFINAGTSGSPRWVCRGWSLAPLPPAQSAAYPYGATLPGGQYSAALLPFASLTIDPFVSFDITITGSLVFQQPASGAVAGTALALLAVRDSGGNSIAAVIVEPYVPAANPDGTPGTVIVAVNRSHRMAAVSVPSLYRLNGLLRSGPPGLTVTFGNNGSVGQDDATWGLYPVNPR